MSRLVNQANAQGFLTNIEAPVLGLYPTAGQITSEMQERLLQEGLKHFEVVHLPASYHMVQLLYPRACTEELIRFCSRHDGGFLPDD